MRLRNPARLQGIALVLVMWVLSLLTVMALALTQIQRTEGALTANQLEAARFRARATAALNLVALNLMTTPAVTFEADAIVLMPDGQPQDFMLDDHRLLLKLSNETSKFDLNAISRNQLITLIEYAQGAEDQDELVQAQIADAILDWRDADNLSLLNGAEDDDYRAAGRSFGAADRPFQTVEELRQVLGLSPALYAKLAPYLRVESASAGRYDAFSAGRSSPGGGGAVINETFAAAPVLAALHGYAFEEAERIVEQRSQGLFADAEDPQPVSFDRGGPLYHLRITEPSRSERGRSMEALIRVDSGLEVVWQQFGSASVDVDVSTTANDALNVR
ncbi:MAG: type II secretion system protein GspK [Lamprobacter sp.]|uniref:general secretion pathway protein GspK n=1 Tax=Lamprobacter sp. TaxID=3100796 RepID=UPI002B2591A9|nr:type II secretion system protein GspK [Lamprobacter sp.]MEA3638347.1 type II secretion system protein GspK [Lamprobacter sp.]